MTANCNVTHRIAQKMERWLMLFVVSAALSALAFAQQPVRRGGTAAPRPATKSGTNSTPAAAQKLPLRKVVLYKSGIGYFEHAGYVHGNEDVEIDLTSSQLDDVLKSLTALDLNGGRIIGASYNSQEPAGHQLEALPVNVADKASLSELLQELRGARIEVRTSAGAFTGRLLSVEEKTRRENGADVKVDQISLLGDGGEVRSFILGTGLSVRFADRDLEQELSRALGLLDASHQEDTRHLILSTAGTGERQIHVSYISEVPVWKTTYRIVLPSAASPAGAKPLLQGWAVVDNTVGEDWNNVELSLAAGAPQSFIQQLSQPYYITRPTVGMPRGVVLTPQTHGSTLFGGPGALIGLVKDPAGNVVEGARVRILGLDDKQVAETISDSSGRYVFDNLPPGKYNLEFSSTSFRTLRMNSASVMAGLANRYDGRLEIGAVAMSTSMEAGPGQGAIQMGFVSRRGGGTLSTTVTGKAITNLPFNSRSAILMGLLDPGRQTSGGSRNSTFEGLPKGTINMTFDGVNIRDNMLSSSDGFFAVNDPRIDDVEEFNITAENAREGMRGSVTAAQGALLGDMFHYKLRDRVTIRKNQSALVPIVQSEITAEKVALWNAGMHSPRPLLALWFTNSSDQVLDGGSFNVIDEGAFAGEGLMATVHAGERRLISYAADLGLQVLTKQDSGPAGEPVKVTRIRVSHGSMISTVESRERVTYTIRNDDSSARTLILEHPVRNDWNPVAGLVAEEKSATYYRFRVEVQSKETKEFTVEETHPVDAAFTLSNLTAELIQGFSTGHHLTPELETMLREVLSRKDGIAKLDAELEKKDDEVDKITEDQERLRENLKALKGGAEEKALIERYVRQLTDEENRLDAIHKEIAALTAKRDQAQKDLDAYIASLTLEVTF